jgi:hypothetical protein
MQSVNNARKITHRLKNFVYMALQKHTNVCLLAHHARRAWHASVAAVASVQAAAWSRSLISLNMHGECMGRRVLPKGCFRARLPPLLLLRPQDLLLLHGCCWRLAYSNAHAPKAPLPTTTSVKDVRVTGNARHESCSLR